MDISSVGSFPVQCGGSLIILQPFRCRNLALNRAVLPTLKAGMWEGIVRKGGICTPPYVCMLPIHLDAPTHLYAPRPPLYICVFYMYPKCHGDFGGHLYTSLSCGDISTSFRHFCVCQYIHCLSVHKSYQLLPITVGCFFTRLDVFGCLLYVMLVYLSL